MRSSEFPITGNSHRNYDNRVVHRRYMEPKANSKRLQHILVGVFRFFFSWVFIFQPCFFLFSLVAVNILTYKIAVNARSIVNWKVIRARSRHKHAGVDVCAVCGCGCTACRETQNSSETITHTKARGPKRAYRHLRRSCLLALGGFSLFFFRFDCGTHRAHQWESFEDHHQHTNIRAHGYGSARYQCPPTWARNICSIA